MSTMPDRRYRFAASLWPPTMSTYAKPLSHNCYCCRDPIRRSSRISDYRIRGTSCDHVVLGTFTSGTSCIRIKVTSVDCYTECGTSFLILTDRTCLYRVWYFILHSDRLVYTVWHFILNSDRPYLFIQGVALHTSF
jgi:hypothetical protein